MKNNSAALRPVIVILPFVLIVVVWIVREFFRVGSNHLDAFQWQILVRSALFVLGGVGGNLLVQTDKLMTKYHVSVPGMEQLVSQWSKSIRNVLTCGILAIVGIWVVSSSGVPFGWGVILGIQLKLFYELLFAADYSSWYWIFARPFSLSEHKIFLLIWAGALLSQVLILI